MNKQNKSYDVAVIGSGLSGLVCAYILSKEGYKVVVLEKNKQIGGCLQTFVRDKRIFDVGVHYLGGLEKGQTLYQYFSYLEIMDQLKLEQMDKDAFDIIRLGRNSPDYRLAQGWDRFVEQLAEQFPHEYEGLNAYRAAMTKACSDFPLYTLQADKEYPTDIEHLSINAEQKIASLIKDPLLRAILGGNNMLYAGKGAVTPFHLHALVCNSYIESAWRCVDGGSQIARAVLKNIRRLGGDLMKQAEVDQFTFSGGVIKEVVLTTGEAISVKHVVSSAHPAQLSRFVRHEKGALRKAYLNRINRTQATPGIFSVHYTLRPDSVPYIKSNYYQHDTNNVWQSYDRNGKHWPSTYLALTPRSAKSETYADSLATLAYMDYKALAPWSDSFNTVAAKQKRGTDYEAMKEEYTERLLEVLYKDFPMLKGNVLNAYASTPLSFRDYIGDPSGSLYGFERDYRDPLRTILNTQTRIPNLLLTGQNINMHGILGVTVSAVRACSTLVDKDKLINEIRSAS